MVFFCFLASILCVSCVEDTRDGATHPGRAAALTRVDADDTAKDITYRGYVSSFLGTVVLWRLIVGRANIDTH